jgi:CheY-like chemotaxis protein
MDIISHQQYRQFLDYLPKVKASIKDWQLATVQLLGHADQSFTAQRAAELLADLFADHQGKLYICNDRQLFMLILWGQHADSTLIPRHIKHHLPPGSCSVAVQPSTAEGLSTLEVRLHLGKIALSNCNRHANNIVLVADDDLYMRTLIKKGIGDTATVYEVEEASGVLPSYDKYRPDVLFLDIHLPGRNGSLLLADVLNFDHNAYVIMFSGDSSKENVERTSQLGAKGFMAKPFLKTKLHEYLRECPTFRWPAAPEHGSQ